MPTKIRLQRHGKKGHAYFHLVVADSRAPRDGKKIEKLGVYDPNTNPATIDIDVERTLEWFQKGAQPTDTCRAILSYKGVLYKNHLLEGVKKGAFSLEEAEKRFAIWSEQKQGKVDSKKESLAKKKIDTKTSRLKAESVVREKIASKVAVKRSPLAQEVAATEASAEESASAE